MPDTDWKPQAEHLAAETAIRSESRWYTPLATTPRHLFVPRWWEWEREASAWTYRLHDGPRDPDAWMRAAYHSGTTLITRIGPLHADHAEPGAAAPEDRPTSSSTMPHLMVLMYRHAVLTDTSRVLLTTGSGYGTALACARLGDAQVTSVDVDPYLTEAASERLDLIGMRPTVQTGDITGPLPGEFDRIISTVSVPHIPPSWLTALKPGGRLVTTLSGTGLIVVADKAEDGGAVGHVAPESAGFMTARHGDDYDHPRDGAGLWERAEHADGDVTTGRYPLVYVPRTWDLKSTLELTVPGIQHRQTTSEDGRRTVYMTHTDGSWARATADDRLGTPTVHQGGPRRLWDELDRIRTWLAIDGDLPVRGATVTITPDGTTTVSRSGWSATSPA
ncbi:methyltransferase type 11 [Streptomyces sp. PmtG]